jgi:hypothetical protein
VGLEHVESCGDDVMVRAELTELVGKAQPPECV